MINFGILQVVRVDTLFSLVDEIKIRLLRIDKYIGDIDIYLDIK